VQRLATSTHSVIPSSTGPGSAVPVGELPLCAVPGARVEQAAARVPWLVEGAGLLPLAVAAAPSPSILRIGGTPPSPPRPLEGRSERESCLLSTRLLVDGRWVVVPVVMFVWESGDGHWLAINESPTSRFSARSKHGESLTHQPPPPHHTETGTRGLRPRGRHGRRARGSAARLSTFR
jgi:hypothetical protein